MQRYAVMLAGLGLTALALVGAQAWRDYAATHDRELTGFERLVDAHVGRVRDHLASRVQTARVVAAVFVPPRNPSSEALAGWNARVLPLLPEVFSFVWVQNLPVAQATTAEAVLKGTGALPPLLKGAGGSALRLNDRTDELKVILDIVPKTPQNVTTLGLDLASLPLPREALARAMQEQQPIATAPLELVQLPGVPAVVMYAPVMHSTAEPAGFVGFSYRLDALIAASLDTGDERLPFQVADSGDRARVISGAPVHPPLSTRTVEFAGRSWVFSYPIPPRIARTARLEAMRTAGVGGLLTIIFLALGWLMVVLNDRLSAALTQQRATETRLRTLVGELNHRVKNLMAVVQAVVMRSLGPDVDDGLRRTIAGRFSAMAHALTLLTTQERTGATMRDLAVGAHLVMGERIQAQGPKLHLKPAVAQSLALLLHELSTNALKHGALSVERGKVDLTWSTKDETFVLNWVEHGGPPASCPTRSGFGMQLIEKLTPAAVGGECRVDYASEGLRYTLSAPLKNVRRDDRDEEFGGEAWEPPTIPAVSGRQGN